MKYFFLLLLLTLCFSCSGQQSKKQTAGPTETPTFQLPTIPTILSDPVERAEYLLKHYWDNFDFTDTAYIHLPEITEQAFVDYIDVMPIVSTPFAALSIKDLMNKAEVDPTMFNYFANMFEKYLYDPNSPFRNDELYIPVLESVLASPLTKEKIRPTHLLELAKKNRIGETAIDFTYTLANGTKSTMQKIQSDYTVLFFYNPGCHSCKEITDNLQSSLTIKYLMSEKKLKVLAIYPDEDLSEWQTYLSSIPKEWINAYDDGTHLFNEELYDLKAIPTLYLLDKEKKVLLKDTTFEQLENFLRQ